MRLADVQSLQNALEAVVGFGMRVLCVGRRDKRRYLLRKWTWLSLGVGS